MNFNHYKLIKKYHHSMKYLSPSYLQLFSQFFDPESAQETEIYIDFNLLSYRSFHFLASGMLYHTAADITCPH